MKENLDVNALLARVAECEDEYTSALYAIAVALIDARKAADINTQKLCSKLDQLIQTIKALR